MSPEKINGERIPWLRSEYDITTEIAITIRGMIVIILYLPFFQRYRILAVFKICLNDDL
ncbi:MAG: hypothetical protein M1162_01890 [Candidatus Thermoplasmatota archaeon]|nr:hypothetical protein [Candidatus Thermoplasmatota archaeon]